ncbi:MAG: type II toxin-antitoxin system RelE/ParE family toxin [Magnetococcales bacterium]|nr:type II toxin-antitoxin system RelE/ParE family toxin [Magnetococcales bacterium]
MWTIQIERSFQKSFSHLHVTFQRQISDFIEDLIDDPRSPLQFPNFLMFTNRPNQGRFRFGKYRIGVTVDFEREVVFFNFVGARGDFYKRFK